MKEHIMTTKEFFESEANNIIEELESFYNIQRGNKEKYLNSPFPDKEEFLERFENGIDDIYEELETDYISREEEEKMIEKQKERILETYNRISEIRNKFKEKYNLTI